MQIQSIKDHCDANNISFIESKDGHKFIITKKRAIKIVLKRYRIAYSFWDANRQNYGPHIKKEWPVICPPTLDHHISDDWYNSIVELLETEAAKPSKLKEYPIVRQEFSNDCIVRYTNGLVKMNATITQAFVSSVVKVTNRGIIKEVKPSDDCECWFFIDGRGKCVSSCDGRVARIIYDGESQYATVEKTDKSYRISDNRLDLNTVDKAVVDAALKLFLTLKEKDQGG